MPKEPKSKTSPPSPIIVMQINPQPGQKGGKLQPSTVRGWGGAGEGGEGDAQPIRPDTNPGVSPLPTSHFSNSVGKTKN